MYISIHIYIYICIYIHIHIYTYVYIYAALSRASGRLGARELALEWRSSGACAPQVCVAHGSVLQCVAVCCDSEFVRNSALQGHANLRHAVHVSKETNIHERRPAIETYKYEKRPAKATCKTRPAREHAQAWFSVKAHAPQVCVAHGVLQFVAVCPTNGSILFKIFTRCDIP